MWLAYNLWRYTYFGDLTPNTAYAQGIDAVGWLERFGDSWELDSTKPYLIIFVKQGIYILAASLPLLYFARYSQPALLLFAVIGCIIVAGCLSPFIFGDARLDKARTTTHLAVFVVLGLGLIIYQIKNRRIKNRKLLLGIASALALGVVGVVAFNIYGIPRYYMCCGIYEFDPMRQQFNGLAEREELPRPTVLISDLGGHSWHKHFNVVDMGRLGSPITSKLHHSEVLHPFSNYLLDYAAPDFIPSKLACAHYQIVLAHPEFGRRYRMVSASAMEFVPDSCSPLDENLSKVWIRADILRTSESPERKLIDTLSSNLSIDALRQELASCQSAAGNNCVYIARTAYRFLPEFRNAGLIDELNQIFSASRTKDYDLYLINGYRDGQAHQKAIEFIVNNWIAKVR